MSVREGDKKCSLGGYVGKITVNLKLEEVKILVDGKASSRESDLQISSCWEETVRLGRLTNETRREWR